MPRTWRRRAIPVGEALAAVAREIGMEGRLHELAIHRVWRGAVGPATAEHAEPAGLQGGTLLVHVTDSAWLHRLSMARRDLVRNLNDRLDAAVVKSVRLRIGPVGEPRGGAGGRSHSVPGTGAPARAGGLLAPAVGPEDPAIGRALAHVKDLPCGEVIQRILRRHADLTYRR